MRKIKSLIILIFVCAIFPPSHYLIAQTPVIIDTLAYTQISNLTDIHISSRIRTSADGTKLIFTGNFKMVYTMNADGSQLKQVFDYAAFREGCPCVDVFIDISGDGSTILWTDGINEIFTANFDGINTKEIATLIPRESPFADVEPDIRLAPRLTYDGSMVFFFNVAGGIDAAGLYTISSDGTGLTKLFSYKDMSQSVFGLDGSEFNPNTAFSNYLDISQDGTRGIFATHSIDLGNGHTIAFNNSTMNLLRNYAPLHAHIPTGIGQLSISRDGSRVAIPFRDGSTWVEKIHVMDFNGDNQIELPFIFGTASTFQLDSTGLKILATTHLPELADYGTALISMIDIESSKILDLALLEGNPQIVFRGARSPVINYEAGTVFFVNGVARGDSFEQMWKLDINPESMANHPTISGVNFSPNYVLFDASNYSTFTASVTPGVGDILFVNWDTFMDGSYVFRGLRTYGTSENLVDDGTFGDVVIGDGIYTRSEVYRDLLQPPAELTIRIHADAGKYITSVDVVPFFVWDSLATSIDDDKKQSVPDKYELYSNYPNPFNPSTMINYSIPKQSFVTLKIFDALGREITTLVSGVKSTGNYKAEFNAAIYPSGIYFYQLKTNDFLQVKKMVLLR